VTTASAVYLSVVCYFNQVPLAYADSFSATEDTPLTITAPGVLANDVDDYAVTPIVDSLSAALVDNSNVHGTLTLNGDGSFSYSPTPDYNGPATFTYNAYDGEFYSNTVTVTITVAATNDAPVSYGDTYTTFEDTTLTTDLGNGVLFNDIDIDSLTLTAVLGTGPSYASAFTLNSDGTFTYAPSANYNGPDSFTYRAYDGGLYSGLATVTITVNPVNDKPVANPQTGLTVIQEYSLDITLAGVDPIDGASIVSYTIQSAPAHGELWAGGSKITTYPAVLTSGNIQYKATGISGIDTFTFTVTDNGIPMPGVESDPATISLTVIGLHSTLLKHGWNLVSNPCNVAINKADLIVNYAGANHAWSEAIPGVVMDTIYGWDRTSQVYTTATTLQPGEAYWIWAFSDCQLRFASNVDWSGTVTPLKYRWNMMGVPTDAIVNPTILHIQVGAGLPVTWTDAVSTYHYILGYIYGWDRTTQQYVLPDPSQFSPGEGYWMYAYVDCTLQQ